jgi:hypothetical protein
MKLYIRVENGNAVFHPVFESNLLQVFPNGIPENDFQPFEHSGKTVIANDYQISSSTYVKREDGVWTEQWSVRDMTDEEKLKKQEDVTTSLNNRIAQFIRLCDEAVISLTINNDLAGVNAWIMHKESLQTYTPTTLIPLFPPLPTPPFKDQAGIWQKGPLPYYPV